jgi:hypothetical protein
MSQAAKLWLWRVFDTLAQPARMVNNKGRAAARAQERWFQDPGPLSLSGYSLYTSSDSGAEIA